MLRNTFKKNNIDPENDDIIFQVIDWYSTDVKSDIHAINNQDEHTEYAIKAFGVDEIRRSIALTITGFKPYYYISIVGIDLSNIKNYNKVRTHFINEFLILS